MSELQLIADFFLKQPILAYSLLAALILAVVPLITGFARLDILGALSPQGLLSIVIASGLAWLIYVQGSQIPWVLFQSDSFLLGLSRFPLYIVALAYGSSAGILAAALFLAFGVDIIQTQFWPHGILILELAVVGWFALSPSPRHSRFAGPFGAIVAYVLTWTTAGLAYLEASAGNGSSLAAHFALHEDVILGAALSWVLLLCIGPSLYRRLFPYSRIVPPGKTTPGPAQSRTQSTVFTPFSRSSSSVRERTIAPLQSSAGLPDLSHSRSRNHASLPTLRALPDSSKPKGQRELPSITIEELE